jgi:hypothetical protein
MMRSLMICGGFVFCALLLAACDSANKAAKKVEEGATKAATGVKELAKEATEEAKVAVIKPMEMALPKIEEKIKGLSGEAATKGKEQLDAFKKLLDECKTAAPAQWQSLKDKLVQSFDDLKKLAGL